MAPSDTDIVSSWVTCGNKTPRSEVVFLCQVLILYTVIVVSIYKLYNSRIGEQYFVDGTAKQLLGILAT